MARVFGLIDLENNCVFRLLIILRFVRAMAPQNHEVQNLHLCLYPIAERLWLSSGPAGSVGVDCCVFCAGSAMVCGRYCAVHLACALPDSGV